MTFKHALDRFIHRRRAQDGREMPPGDVLGADQFLRRRIGVFDNPLRIENKQGFGQGANHAQVDQFSFLRVQLGLDHPLNRRRPYAPRREPVAHRQRGHERAPGEQDRPPVGKARDDNRGANAGADADRPHEIAGAHARRGVADKGGEVFLHSGGP